MTSNARRRRRAAIFPTVIFILLANLVVAQTQGADPSHSSWQGLVHGERRLFLFQAEDRFQLKQLSAGELFSRMTARHRWQVAHLNGFSEIRTYQLENEKHKVLAKEVVAMKYRAPESKAFTIISATGSGYIRRRVFEQMIKDEKRTEVSKRDPDGLINPDNYTFELAGTTLLGSIDCFIVHAIPKRKETHLFEGKIWITRDNFAIVRITGRLAKSPSFWIKHVDFVRDYQKVESFWLPSRVEAVSDVRIFGKRVLTIQYGDPKINEAETPVFPPQR